MSTILWIAAGAGVHPTEGRVWSDFGVVWVIAGVGALILTVSLLAIWSFDEK